MAINDLTKTYSESFNTLTDAEKQDIRGKAVNRSYVTDLVGEKVGAQDAFRGLAADLLKTTIDKLKEQKAKEGQFDMFKGLPGFSEIADMGGSISNSILGELGGAAGMGGVDAGALFGGEGGKDGLEKQINNMVGLGFLQGPQYNWQKWFDEELSKRYENMKKIKGIDEANKTYKLEKNFKDSFIKDYIKPRFDYSKSIDEFVSYINVKQDEENILQTETTLKKYKDLIKKKAEKFYQDLTNKKIGFDTNFYTNPLSAYTKNEDGTYPNITAEKQTKYENQKNNFDAAWEQAKTNPDQALTQLGGKSWNQMSAKYGYSLTDRNQFARLHYNVIGAKRKYDGAKDLFTEDDLNNYINEEIIPGIGKLDLKFGNKPFMEFVSPEKYADDLLADYNVGTEEYSKLLKDLGIDTKNLDPNQVKEQFIEGLRTGRAEDIRAAIKYYNENKKKPSQKLLGVSYIEREEDYDKDAISEKANPLYALFAKSGYQGTEDEFFTNFMPDADKEDMKLIEDTLDGDGLGGMFKNLDTSDPFAALSSIGGLMGDDTEKMYGDDKAKSSSSESNYFDIFGAKEKEYDDYTNKYSGIFDIGSFGSFNYF